MFILFGGERHSDGFLDWAMATSGIARSWSVSLVLGFGLWALRLGRLKWVVFWAA